eukprot:c17813_g1_i1.p1 GENE.c17813_g1_i1~~c17813_g1_i1.p1  ORF type:complete len:308 (-),score=47.41 c17813_g1_i1:104-1027(-)
MAQTELSAQYIQVGDKLVENKNCWHLILSDGDWEYEKIILAFTIVFLLINFTSKRLGRWYGHPLNIRPTLVASGGHGGYTSVAAIIILYLGPEYYWIWQRVILPSSLGYFVHDILIYCIPQKDWLITFHHLVMIGCEFPIGDYLGAHVYGAGDGVWAVYLCMLAYSSELVIPILGYRWWLLQTLDKHTPFFTHLSYLILVMFAARCVLVSYVMFCIVSHYSDYFKYQQGFTLGIILFGHAAIVVMAVHWLRMMLGSGVKEFLLFKKRPQSKGGFSFTANFRASNNNASDASDSDKKKSEQKNDKKKN